MIGEVTGWLPMLASVARQQDLDRRCDVGVRD
jgi:hypothetical protein